MPLQVIDVLRRFLPDYLAAGAILHRAQHRAVWAITHCRTAVMGGHLHACAQCGKREFSFHSCNHRSCPQCGRSATAQWVERELDKRVNAPYFMVTFTLPSELRELFFGAQAKQAYDLLFAASSVALSGTLASPRWLGARRCGFTGVLHTWNQRLHFHPHIHYLVPGAGLDAEGKFVRVKNENFLVPVPVLRIAFRQQLREALNALGWQVDPVVWTKDWGVHVQPFGSGAVAIKYLGAYVCRTAIGDSRVVSMNKDTVSYRWKDRSQGGRSETETIPGTEFAKRYLRHVLPKGLRAVRYFGFCHPTAKRVRERIAFLSGRTLLVGPFAAPEQSEPARLPICSCCRKPMERVARFRPDWSRGPPPERCSP